MFFKFDGLVLCQTNGPTILSKYFEHLKSPEKIEGLSVAANIENVFLLRCSALCSNDFNCNVFQFSVSAGKSEGICLLLHQSNDASEAFVFKEFENTSCRLYKNVLSTDSPAVTTTVVVPTTTKATTTTTVVVPTTTKATTTTTHVVQTSTEATTIPVSILWYSFKLSNI